MQDWFSHNFWWVLPILGLVVMTVLKVRHRGGDEPMPLRIIYSWFPILDAKSEVRRQLTPLRVFLWCVATIIAIAYLIYDGGYVS